MLTPKPFNLLIATLVFASCTQDSPPSSIFAPEYVTIDSQAIAGSFGGKVVPAARHRPHSPPFMNGEPEHLRFVFDNDKLSRFVHYRERQLLLYPIDAYRELYRTAPWEQAKFDKRIRLLKQLIANNSRNYTDVIPVFPPVEAMQVFCSQIRNLDFAEGSGVRFVASYATGAGGTTNESIFYTFQGLSSDGRYYISVFYPITAKGLPRTEVTLVTINFLNRLTPADFTPDLSKMDDMIESLRLAEPGLE